MVSCGKFLQISLVVLLLTGGLAAQDVALQVERLLADGETRQAGYLFRQAANDADSTEQAAAWLNNACVLLTRAGEVDDALTDCTRAIEMRRAAENEVGLARSLNNLALALQTSGRLQEAAERYREALSLNSRIGEERSAVINGLNLGAVASFRGDYDGALRFYRDAESRALRADQIWTARQVFIARQNQGSALERLDAHEQALAIYLSLLEDGRGGGDAGITISDRANVEHNVGVVYRNLGDAVEAEARIRSAIELFGSIGDRAGLASAWLNLGLVQQFEFKDTEAAIDSLERALALALRSGDVGEEVQVLSYLIDLLVQDGRAAQAEELLKETRSLLEGRQAPESEWLIETGAAKIAASRGDLETAVLSAQRALAAIQRTAEGLEAGEDRSRFVEARRSAFEFTVDLLLEKADAGDSEALVLAFETSLQAKERLLAERGGPSERTLARLFSYQRIREALRGAQLMELVQVGDDLVRFSVHPRGLAVRRFALFEDFEKAAVGIRRRLAAGESPDRADLDLLSSLVVDLEFSDRLFIAATGGLSFFPWEVIPLGPASTSQDVLLDVTAIAMLPSAAYLHGSPVQSRNLRWLTVTVPEVEPMTTSEFTLRQIEVLEPLQFTAREARAVAEELGGKGVSLDQELATAEGVLSELGRSRIGVVHVAAHTVIDGRPGGGAAILLHDGPLSTGRLEASTMQVNLAVLAACSTQADGSGTGRMLGTLTGAWLSAGAGAVLATLWDVDDQTTLGFMEQFYYQLGRGLSPQMALAQTKRRLRMDPAWRQRESLWAAYVLVGDAEPVVAKNRWWWAIGGVGLVLLALFAVVLRHRLSSS